MDTERSRGAPAIKEVSSSTSHPHHLTTHNNNLKTLIFIQEMEKIYNQQYLEINRKVKNTLRDSEKKFKKCSFSITGSPLMESKFLLIGNNWGGCKEIKSQKEMPLVNDILAEPTNQTYKGYLDFFHLIFDGNFDKVFHFMNNIVYMNSNFIRTPNEDSEYYDRLKFGRESTLAYLTEIIELINSNIIICFGNATISATSQICKSLGMEEPFWTLPDVKNDKTKNNWNTYFIPIEYKDQAYQIFSFPHASRFNQWKREIDQNETFAHLKKLLMTNIDKI